MSVQQEIKQLTAPDISIRTIGVVIFLSIGPASFRADERRQRH